MNAAATQLAKVGFEAMTMEGILTEAGIAKRTLYRWWPSKSAVVTEAVLEGFIPVPNDPIPQSGDIWADLQKWLESIALALRGPYGEVLRASVAIGTSDPALGNALAKAFAEPARASIALRLQLAINDGQISTTADLEAAVDLLMSIIVFVGVTRADPDRVPSVLRVIRSGLTT